MSSEHLSSADFVVVDTETTGLDPKIDGVVEVACLRVRGGAILERFGSLVNPGRAIPARASAIHGISDRDVADAPTLGELEGRLVAMSRDAIVVAHNARFDRGFLPFVADRPYVCTLRLARRLVRDAPNHRNETLRSFLRLATDVPSGVAHRAEVDAAVTASLFFELLRRFERDGYEPTVASLLRDVARPRRLDEFPFGMHRGRRIDDVPAGYLRWIARSDFDDWPDVRHTALLELGRRASEANEVA